MVNERNNTLKELVAFGGFPFASSKIQIAKLQMSALRNKKKKKEVK
jgi:hypothetical protein